MTVKKNMVSKTGSYDSSGDKITWTITVNADGNDIAGYVLADDMLQYSQSLTISPSTGYTVVRDSNGKVAYIQFTGDPTNTNTYTITYTTEHKETISSSKVENVANLGPDEDGDGKPDNGNTSSGGTSVWVPAAGGVDKAFAGANKTDGILNWSINVTVPDGGIPANTILYDHAGYSWSVDKNHWLTPAQLHSLNETLQTVLSGIDYSLEFSTDGNHWQTYAEALADTSVLKYYCFRVVFNEDVPASKFENQTISFTYSTTAELGSTDATYVNTVSIGGFQDTESYSYKPTAVKTDRYGNLGTSNLTSTDGVIGWYVRVVPESPVSSFTVKDYLPEGVTLTKIGISSGSNVSGSTAGSEGTIYGWNNLKAVYKVTGQTVELTVTPNSGETIPASSNPEIYIYFECQITDLPAAGTSGDYSFTNTADVVIDSTTIPVEQTQNITVNRPANVLKLDRNGSSADSSHQYDANDNTLGWYVQIYLDSDTTPPVTVVDTLPDGLTLTKIGIGGDTHSARYNNSVTASSSGGTISAYNSSYSLDGQTVTVTINNNNNTISAGSYLYVYLECTMDSVPISDVSYQNNAVVNVGSTELGRDDQTQTVLMPQPENNIVDKESIWKDEIDQLQYSVLINPSGEDLDEDSDTILVQDIMSYYYNPWWNTINSRLITSSVKLYRVQTDGSGNALKDADGNYVLGDQIPATDWSWTFSDNFTEAQWGSTPLKNTITATVPDETPLVLVYAYAISIDTEYDTNFDITNTATVYGDAKNSDEVSSRSQWTVSEISAGIIVSGTYTLTKVQEGNYGVTLPGAEFTLYTYADGLPVTVDGEPVVFVTDESGVLQIRKTMDGFTFKDDTVYFVMETKAPAGYALPSNPEKYYFYYGTGADGYEIPSNAVNLSQSYGIAFVENAQSHGSITVSKVWLDASRNPTEPGADSITFKLYQVDVHGNQTLYSDTEYTISGVSWQITIPDLPMQDESGNPYTYTAKETKVLDGWVFGSATDAEGNITITNERQKNETVTVNKAWDDSITVRPGVSVQLYQAALPPITEYTAYLTFADGVNGSTDGDWWPSVGTDSMVTFTDKITGAGDYSISWNLADYGWDAAEGCIVFCIDIFDPDNALSGYSVKNLAVTADGTAVSLTGTTASLIREGNYSRIALRNIYTDTNMLTNLASFGFNTNLTVSFTLVGPNDSTTAKLPELHYIPTSASSGGTAYGDPVTLSSDGGWTHTWTDLPYNGVDANGDPLYYLYYVKELTSDYDVTTSTSKDSNGNPVITLTNKPKSTVSIKVNKDWIDLNGNTLNDAPTNEIQFELYQKEESTTSTSAVATVATEGTVSLTFSILGSDNLTFAVEHASVQSNVLQVESGSTVRLELVNKYGKSTEDWGRKAATFSIGDGGSLKSSTYADHDDGSRTYIIEVVVNSDTTLSGSLDWRTTDGCWSVGSLTVTEPDGSGTTGGNSGNTGEGSGNTDTDTDSNDGWKLIDTYKLTSSDGWTTTISNLDPGTYKIVETTTGYTTTYTVGDSSTNQLTLTSGTVEVTITNQVETTSVTVNKVWIGDATNADMISFKLYQNGVEYGLYYIFRPAEGSTTGWTTTITGLPIKDENGDNYTYTVNECTVDGYISSYGTDSDGNLVITNTPSTDIGVTKVWANGSTERDITVDLYRFTSTTKPGTLTVTPGAEIDLTDATWVAEVTILHGSYTAEFTDLPLCGYENGQLVYYTYVVKEQADEAYTTRYSNVNPVTGGEIVITNVEKRTNITVEKVWSAGTATVPVQVQLYRVASSQAADTVTQFVTTTVDDMDCNAWWYNRLDGIEITAQEVTITFTNTTYSGSTQNKYGPEFGIYSSDDGAASGDSYVLYWGQQGYGNAWGGGDLSGLTSGSAAGELAEKGVTYSSSGLTSSYLSDLMSGAQGTLTAKRDSNGTVTATLCIAGVTSTVTLPVDTSEPVYLTLTGEHTTLTNIQVVRHPEGSSLVEEVTLGGKEPWYYLWSDLPLYGYDSEGNILYYSYYAVETTTGYTTTYSTNSPVTDGTITITNSGGESYELPSSGGFGTQLYTLGGMAICALAVLLYSHKKGRKGAHSP